MISILKQLDCGAPSGWSSTGLHTQKALVGSSSSFKPRVLELFNHTKRETTTTTNHPSIPLFDSGCVLNFHSWLFCFSLMTLKKSYLHSSVLPTSTFFHCISDTLQLTLELGQLFSSLSLSDQYSVLNLSIFCY